MRAILLSGIVLAALAAPDPVLAADLRIKAPPIAPPMPYSWAGFYVGLNVGGAWAKSDADTSQGVAVPGQYATGPCDAGCAFSTSSNSTAAIGGVQAGYNIQTGRMVYGIETDFDWRDQSSSTQTVFNTFFDNQVTASTQQWVGTLRGRIGYAFAPDWLGYASGGLAYGNLQHTVTQTFCFSPTNCHPARAFSDNVTQLGWVVGAGVDYAINRNWSLGVEYLYIRFSDDTLSAPRVTLLDVYPATTATFHDSSQVARARLNYKLY
jgi:outer membrane immunogenic protein